ncbi:MAG TPA: Ig-like domain-containing protein, partial [Gillisia sp.]|nr:Ig-like domain-containing protein [Gillisia sp.]
ATSDNCEVAGVTQTPAPGIIIDEDTRIFLTVTDASGNTAECDFMLRLTEDEVLEIGCIDDQTIRLTTSCSFTLPDYTEDAEVNFSGATVVQSPAPGTVITTNTTVKLTASRNGETDECTFEIILNDIVAPEIKCIDNDTEFALVNGFLTLTPADLDEGTTDNCSFTFSLSQTTFTAVGTYSVSLRATDANGNYTECTRNIKVVEPGQANRPPVAGDNEYTVTMNNVLTIPAPGILSNDSDADGDTLTALLQANVTNGNLSLNSNGSFTYTPNNNFVGNDIFTYVANDGSLNSNIANVTIRVTDKEPEEPEVPVDFEEFIYIYPNPTTGPVNFYVPRSQIIQKVELFDSRGRFILNKEFPKGTTQYSMDLSGLQSSVYIFKIITESGYRIIRVIVK